MVNRHTITAVLMCLPLLAGTSYAADSKYPDFSDALSAGKDVWLNNCEGCHGYGIAGAPIPMRKKDWIQRIDKPMSVLYDHAINGFFGPQDTQMPPRGGNDDLSDQEVMSAVDYMTELVRFYLNNKGN